MQAELFQAMAQAASDPRRLKLLLDEHRAGHPADPQFRYWEGVSASRSNELAKAIEILSEVANAAPTQTAPRYELGFALARSGRHEDAALAYETALNINPKMVPAWINLGFARTELNQLDPAELAFKAALGMDPNYLEAWFGLAALYEKFGAFQQATDLGLEMRGRFGADPHRDSLITRCSILSGNYQQAAEFQQQLLKENPKNTMAQHLLGGLIGQSNRRANDGYVSDLFNGYATNYDDHMVNKMGYKLPVAIADMARKFAPTGKLALDLGCGTGLIGAELPNYHWTGVDLAAKMMDHAKARGYQQLEVSEIESFLERAADHSFDLIVSGNVLIYFGDLAQVIQHSHRVLKPNGTIIFDVETDETTRRFVQAPNGRYTHSEVYLREELNRAGFKVEAVDSVHSRTDRNVPVHSYLVVAKA